MSTVRQQSRAFCANSFHLKVRLERSDGQHFIFHTIPQSWVHNIASSEEDILHQCPLLFRSVPAPRQNCLLVIGQWCVVPHLHFMVS